MFIRPCLLVVDREFAGSISTRKLVLETAKFNVITAYGYKEAVATLERYPALQAVVVSADRSGESQAFLKYVTKTHPGVRRVMTGLSTDGEDLVDRRVESYSPDQLLNALRELFPEPAAKIMEHENELAKEAGET